ncbi:hypothetical protein GGR56DRAFT_648763 [Xylariaceae sp. FL0804]|nr:hypothetical protein GGR56DRAFT_648763 [Xylariaceae sp. FL0804]
MRLLVTVAVVAVVAAVVSVALSPAGSLPPGTAPGPGPGRSGSVRRRQLSGGMVGNGLEGMWRRGREERRRRKLTGASLGVNGRGFGLVFLRSLGAAVFLLRLKIRPIFRSRSRRKAVQVRFRRGRPGLGSFEQLVMANPRLSE